MCNSEDDTDSGSILNELDSFNLEIQDSIEELDLSGGGIHETLDGFDLSRLDGLNDLGLDPMYEMLSSPEFLQNLREAQERMERARNQAQEYISIGPPWEYNPENYSPSQGAIYHAMKWAYEGADSLNSTQDSDLIVLGERIQEGIDSLVDEVEEEEIENPYRSLHLLLSSLDGLIIWLCERDPEIEPNFHNEGGDPVYFSSKKKSALEDWYEEHSVFEVEDGGESFRRKWEAFWHHRHRIMHGSPDAYYEANIGVSTLFFIGITCHVVMERYREINGIESFQNRG